MQCLPSRLIVALLCRVARLLQSKQLRCRLVVLAEMLNVPDERNRIQSILDRGDKVTVELTPYDLSRGRIVYRYK